MIGRLPTEFNVNGKTFEIDTDYRTALLVYEAYADKEYNETEQSQIAIECLVKNYEDMTERDFLPLMEKVGWYLAGGDVQENNKAFNKKVMDWVQDEQMIFAAVNKVTQKEIRELDYMHWWTFLGYFKERGECLFNTVVNIRDKINKREKLTKDEKAFYLDNKGLIDLKVILTAEEQAEKDLLESLEGMNRR